MRPAVSRLLAVAFLLSGLAATPAEAAPVYMFTDLGLLRSGDDFSSANDINEAAQAVGHSGSLTIERAVLWQGGDTIDLGGVPGQFTSMAHGINEAGVIVGGARRDTDDDNNRSFHAVVWNGGAITPLEETPGARESLAYAVNASAQIVGYAGIPDAPQAILWQGVSATILWSGPSIARDINDAGQIAGSIGETAVRWEVDSAGPTFLGDLPGGADSSAAYGINDAGQVVGQGTTADGLRAFLWTNGLMIDLGVLPGTSRSLAHDINSRGQVVGESRDSSLAVNGAFLWDAGELFDLNQLTANLDGWRLISALAINDRGQIVGQAFSPTLLEFHAFLLTPVPEPDAVLLLGLGLTVLVAARQRRRGSQAQFGMTGESRPLPAARSPGTC